MRTRTLTNMIADCRRLAKMENSTFCTDADITEMLNQEIAELETAWAASQGQPIRRSSTTISVTTGTSLYSLPTDFMEVQAVEAERSGQTGTLRPFMPIEHGVLSSDGGQAYAFGILYRVQGNSIEFLPATETFTATVYYTPTTTRLSAGSDTFDGINGFEMAPIYGTVAQMLAMEESDPSFWEARKEKLYRRIEMMAAQRDASMPERVQDVTLTDEEWLI